MPRKLDLNLLQTLEALLSERNVTRAAVRLHTTQPALSAQLARLRHMFDDPLLIPGSRGMTPTPRALEIEPTLRELMAGLRSVVNTTHFDPMTSDATILFAATDSTQFLLAPLLAELHSMAPNMRFAAMPVMRLSKPEIERYLSSGQLDIVIGLTPLFPDDLRVREINQETYVCVMRRGHPFEKAEMSLDDFCSFEHVFISPLGGDFSGDVDRALGQIDRARRVVASVPSVLVATRILETSNFVAVFPQSMAIREAHLLRHYPVPVPLAKAKIAMAWHERTHVNPAHQWFRERIARAMTRVTGSGADVEAVFNDPLSAPIGSAVAKAQLADDAARKVVNR